MTPRSHSTPMIPKSAQQAAETAVAETEWHTLPELLEAYKSLQNELETLRKDRDRLEWLLAEVPPMPRDNRGHISKPYIVRTKWAEQDGAFSGFIVITTRAALDAAMASKPGE